VSDGPCELITKDQWPPHLNPLDYHVWGAMLQAFHKLQSKPKTIPELKSTLQQIWDELPQTTISKAINDYRKHYWERAFQPMVDVLSIYELSGRA